MATVERQWEVICALSNGDICNDLDGPLTWFLRLQHFCSQICQKMVHFRDKVTKEH